MKFMLMMGMKKGQEKEPNGIMSWPKQDIQAHIAFMRAFDKELRASGEPVSAGGLAWPEQARLVRAGQEGALLIDGVFPASKEYLIGFWIVEVELPERAYQVAARASAAPGPGGVPLNMPIEVRQIMSGPPEEFE